ncbi:peptidylprolyl isomerase [Kaistia defluvii]|uniref:peptidylprolyl isomerase n=1 Tax=Kaistia defluvii TaxID=410841 RepID=UPI002B1E0C47|nr:peptidylprolyl isomerase [Kaistia defluvii]
MLFTSLSVKEQDKFMMSRVSSSLTALRGPALAVLGLMALATAPAVAQDAPAPAPAAAPAAAPADPKTVLATVNGQPITEADLTLAGDDFAEELAKVAPDQRRKAILDVLIDLRLMAGAAEKDGLDKSEEFQRRLALLRARALRNEFFRAKVDNAVTDEAVKKRYETEIAKIVPEEEVHAQHILVETEDEAKAIIAELDKGGDFAKLAAEKSKDPGSAKMGGDLGFFTKGKMIKEFEEAAFALEPGKYTEKPVKTQYGYHVIKSVEKRKQPLPTFDQVKDQVRQLVLRDTFVDTVAGLRKDSKVEIVDPTLKAAPSQPAQ